MSIEAEAPVVPADKMTVEHTLPSDWKDATLVGRVMLPNVGPAVVYVNSDGNVIDITNSYATTRDLFEQDDPAKEARVAARTGKTIGKVADVIANSSVRDPKKPFLLAPTDFQEIEAAGVTFVESMVERMVEEAAMKEGGGSATDEVRTRIRGQVAEIVGTDDFSKIKPGSPQALQILAKMKELGMSTIYPTVGLDVEGEIFSKAVAGTAVGHGAQAGYSPVEEGRKHWVNPEPEVVLFGNSKHKIVGAAHGNDVNDRGKEGHSALLLHRAKVKNGSTAIGPFVRLFDKDFTLEDVKKVEVSLEVTRQDGSVKFKGANNMAKISRQPESIMAAAMDHERQHHDGVAVFLGTMTVPLKDDKGQDFTHEEGDVVKMGSAKLGYLTNVMRSAEKVQGLEKGALDLARNLAGRDLLLEKGHEVHAGGGIRVGRNFP